MNTNIDLFWSFRSPYSYICTHDSLKVMEDYNVHIKLRPVLPKAIRTPNFFDKSNHIRIRYLLLDWERRCELLGIPHKWPNPDPVVQNMETLTTAEEQPYIYRLTYLGCEAEKTGKGLKFVAEVSTLIFGGTENWHQGDHLARAAERAGLDLAEMDAAIKNDGPYREEVETNQEDLAAIGHWGVPTHGYNGEPFFGQDRVDSLRFQLEKDGLKL